MEAHIAFCNAMADKWAIFETETRVCIWRVNVANEGDRIAFVRGVTEPLVLRPWGDGYRIVASKGKAFGYLLVKGQHGLAEELCDVNIL